MDTFTYIYIINVREKHTLNTFSAMMPLFTTAKHNKLSIQVKRNAEKGRKFYYFHFNDWMTAVCRQQFRAHLMPRDLLSTCYHHKNVCIYDKISIWVCIWFGFNQNQLFCTINENVIHRSFCLFVFGVHLFWKGITVNRWL